VFVGIWPGELSKWAACMMAAALEERDGTCGKQWEQGYCTQGRAPHPQRPAWSATHVQGNAACAFWETPKG